MPRETRRAPPVATRAKRAGYHVLIKQLVNEFEDTIRPRSLLYEVVRSEVRTLMETLKPGQPPNAHTLRQARSSCAKYITHPPRPKKTSEALRAPPASPVHVASERAASRRSTGSRRSAGSRRSTGSRMAGANGSVADGRMRETAASESKGISDAEMWTMLGPATVGHDYGAWAADSLPGTDPRHNPELEKFPIRIIGGRTRRTYTWEEEGEWRRMAELQAAESDAAEAEKRRQATLRKCAVRQEQERQMRDNAARRAGTDGEWSDYGSRVLADVDAYQAELKAKAERHRETMRQYGEDGDKLVAEVQRRRSAEAAAELRMAQEQARRDAAKAAKAEALAEAKRRRVKEGMKADLAAVEDLKRAKQEAKRREAQEDVRYMKIMAAELERREKQREAMFAGLRARQDANVAAQSSVFEERARQERELADRIARAQEEADRKAAAVLAAKEEQRARFRRELRETVDWQLAEKEEQRRAEKAEAQAIQREAMATKAAVHAESQLRRERQQVEMAAMREALEAQVVEKIKQETAGMSEEEKRSNRVALAKLEAGCL